MLSLQGDSRQYSVQQAQQQQQQVQSQQHKVQQQHRHHLQLLNQVAGTSLYDVFPDHRSDLVFPVQNEPPLIPSSSNINQEPPSRDVDEDMLLRLAHQNYKGGNYMLALDHSKAVYERNPHRTDNLLLLGAIYYQLQDYDACIRKNEEAIQIDPGFAECYGNMANALKEKGNIDAAVRYYLFAIEIKSYADVMDLIILN